MNTHTSKHFKKLIFIPLIICKVCSAQNISSTSLTTQEHSIKPDTGKPQNAITRKRGFDYHNLIIGCDYEYINGERTGFFEEFAPIIGYHLSPHLYINLSSPIISTPRYIYNQSSLSQVNEYDYTNKVKGGRVSVRADIVHYVSLISEFEILNSEFPSLNSVNNTYSIYRKNVPSLFLGIAFNVPITKQVIFSLNCRYNTTYNENTSGYIYPGAMTANISLLIFLSKSTDHSPYSCF